MLPEKVIPIRRGQVIRAERLKRSNERRLALAESSTMASVDSPNRRTVLLAGVVAGLVAGAIIATVLIAMRSVHFADAMNNLSL